jgi:hypothetical protein
MDLSAVLPRGSVVQVLDLDLPEVKPCQPSVDACDLGGESGAGAGGGEVDGAEREWSGAEFVGR